MSRFISEFIQLNIIEDNKIENYKSLLEKLDLINIAHNLKFVQEISNRIDDLRKQDFPEETSLSPSQRVYEWTTMNEFWNSFELTPEFLESFAS